MHEVSGSNPSSPTGNGGDGNPPALGAGNTQFDSEVPDHGSLAQMGERSPEKRQGDDSIASGATFRIYNRTMPYATSEKKRAYSRAWSMQNKYDACACGKRKAKKSRQCRDCHAVDFPEPNLVSAPEVAWIAGILEGEGCWTAHNDRTSWLVAVRMTDQDIIERLYRITGVGRVTREESSRGHKTAWTWAVSARPHREWLTTIVWPWLGVRRRQRILQLWPDVLASQAFSGDVPAFQAGERSSIPR